MKYTWILLGVLVLPGACTKDPAKLTASASLTIINAVTGSTALRTSFAGDSKTIYASGAQVSQNSYLEFSGNVGQVPVALSPTSDTTKVVYSQTLSLEPWSIHSLYVGGSMTQPVSVFTNDTLPNTDDSVVAVRFVNLYSGSSAVNVVISTGTGVTSGLAYPAVSPFLIFSARKSNPATGSYVFQFKDATTSTVIASYTLGTLNTYLHKDLAIVLKGAPGGTGVNAKGTFLVKYY